MKLVLFTVATVLLKLELILVLKLVFSSDVVSVAANRANETKFDGSVLLGHGNSIKYFSLMIKGGLISYLLPPFALRALS